MSNMYVVKNYKADAYLFYETNSKNSGLSWKGDWFGQNARNFNYAWKPLSDQEEEGWSLALFDSLESLGTFLVDLLIDIDKSLFVSVLRFGRIEMWDENGNILRRVRETTIGLVDRFTKGYYDRLGNHVKR